MDTDGADDLAAEFLGRISQVGMGARESIALLVGGAVVFSRSFILDGRAERDEIVLAVKFHDVAEGLWLDMLKTTPPIDPEEAVARLKTLKELAAGPFAGMAVQLDTAIRKAETIKQLRKFKNT